MATTIGRRWKKQPKFDYAAHCDYCGVRWRRSQLRRDRAGKLACPDDKKGRDVVTLAEGNAEGARQWAESQLAERNEDGGAYFQVDTDEEVVHRTTREQIYGDE